MQDRFSTGPTRQWGSAAFALLSLGLLVAAVAQPFPVGLFREFSLPEYYNPPHETQLKSLLQGAEAAPHDEGRILIKKLVLKTFREDGTPGFVMHADDCLYDPEAHKASSGGALEIQTADGRFFTEGEGFLWQEEASTLTISNQVHTRIRLGPVVTPES